MIVSSRSWPPLQCNRPSTNSPRSQSALSKEERSPHESHSSFGTVHWCDCSGYPIVWLIVNDTHAHRGTAESLRSVVDDALPSNSFVSAAHWRPNVAAAAASPSHRAWGAARRARVYTGMRLCEAVLRLVSKPWPRHTQAIAKKIAIITPPRNRTPEPREAESQNVSNEDDQAYAEYRKEQFNAALAGQ